jgi:hypothetical protein
MMPTEVRREQILKVYGFKCSCLACVENWNNDMSILPQSDKNFVPPAGEFPNTFKDAVDEFKKNCDYVKENFNGVLTREIFFSFGRNFGHCETLSRLNEWPIYRDV